MASVLPPIPTLPGFTPSQSPELGGFSAPDIDMLRKILVMAPPVQQQPQQIITAPSVDSGFQEGYTPDTAQYGEFKNEDNKIDTPIKKVKIGLNKEDYPFYDSQSGKNRITMDIVKNGENVGSIEARLNHYTKEAYIDNIKSVEGKNSLGTKDAVKTLDSFFDTLRNTYGLRIERIKGFRVSGAREKADSGGVLDIDLKPYWEKRINSIMNKE